MLKKMRFPFLALLIGAGFIWGSHYFRNQTVRQMEHMLRTHVNGVATIVKKSVSQGVWSTSTLYSLYEDRLLTTAHLFSYLDEHQLVTSQVRAAEQVVVHLPSIDLPDTTGTWGPISQSQRGTILQQLGQEVSFEMLETPALREHKLICMIYDTNYHRGLLCHNDTDFIQLKKASGVGPLLDALSTENISHIALQDKDGILAAAPSNASISTWKTDPVLRKIFQGKKGMVRKIDIDNTPHFEGLYPFKMVDGTTVVIRVAMDATVFKNIKTNADHRHIAVVVLVGVIELLLLILFVAIKRWQQKQVEIEQQLKQQAEENKHWELIGSLSATVAHEVRNPLNAILMTSQRLKHEFQVSPSDEEDYLRLLQILSNESNQLNKIVTDFLDLGKPHQLNFERLSLAELTHQIVETYTLRAQDEQKEITVQIPSEIEIELDRQRFSQILSNLIGNGLDAVSQHGRITIGATQQGSVVIIQVSDNGIGLAPDKIDAALKPFVSYKANGTGLGLALVARFTKLHDGTFTLHSNADVGVTANLSLPISRKNP